MAPLVSCYAIELFDDGSQVRSPPDAGALIAAEGDARQQRGREPTSRIQREQGPVTSVPTVLRLSY